MKFSCEQCGTRYSIADQKVEGKRLRIRCKVCNFIMDVRGAPKHLIQAKVSRSETTVQAAPEMPPKTDWYVAKGGEPIGPVAFSALAKEIKERRLPRDVLVWNETFSDWKSATDVPELARLLPPPVPVPPAPVPDSPVEDSAIDTYGAPISDTATEPAKFEVGGDESPGGNVDVDAAVEAVVKPSAEPMADTPIEDIADLSLSDVEALSVSGQLDVETAAIGPEDGTFDRVVETASEDENFDHVASDEEDQGLLGSSVSQDNTEMVSLDEIESLSGQKDVSTVLPSQEFEAPSTETQTKDDADADTDTAGVGEEPLSVDVVSEPTVETVTEVAPQAQHQTDVQDESVDSLETGEDELSSEPDRSHDEQGLASVDEESSVGDGSSACIDSADSVSDTGFDDGETPVWLGTDDRLPQFVAPTETVPQNQSAVDDDQDGHVEDAILPPADEAPLVDASPIEIEADIDEPTVDISVQPVGEEEVSGGAVLLRPTEPGNLSTEPATPFVMPSTPQPPKPKGSSKTIPAVLIAVVGILLVTFLVLRDDGYGPISPEPSSSNTNAADVAQKSSAVSSTTNQQIEKQVEPTKRPIEKPDVEDKPVIASDDPASPKPTKKALGGKVSIAKVESDRNRTEKSTGLLAEELGKTEGQLQAPEPKTTNRPKRKSGLLASAVQDKPAKSKSSKESLLAALSADDDDDELDVTKLGSLKGGTASKENKTTRGRAERLMNSSNRLEQFERRKMARLDQPKVRGVRKNRERLLDLPSDSEVDSGSGGFPAEDVSRIFNRERKGINVCYNKHLKKGGRRFRRQLKLVFSVGPTGKATGVSIGSRYERTVMKSCLSKFIGRLKFPPFEGRAQKVEFNLKLSNIY